jgi:hypothetical protein
MASSIAILTIRGTSFCGLSTATSTISHLITSDDAVEECDSALQERIENSFPHRPWAFFQWPQALDGRRQRHEPAISLPGRKIAVTVRHEGGIVREKTSNPAANRTPVFHHEPV